MGSGRPGQSSGHAPHVAPGDLPHGEEPASVYPAQRLRLIVEPISTISMRDKRSSVATTKSRHSRRAFRRIPFSCAVRSLHQTQRDRKRVLGRRSKQPPGGRSITIVKSSWTCRRLTHSAVPSSQSSTAGSSAAAIPHQQRPPERHALLTATAAAGR